MSVLECDRNGCKNIMCDRVSHNYGYICDECFEELKMTLPVSIDAFMESPKEEECSMFNLALIESYEDEFEVRG